MARKMVPTVDKNSTKQEEIAALKAMAACASEGSYLHSLLTRDFIREVTIRIGNDWSTDVYGDYSAWLTRERRERDEAMASLRDEIANLKCQLRALEGDVRAAEKREEKALEKAGNLERQRDFLLNQQTKFALRCHESREVISEVWQVLTAMMEKRDAAEARTDRVLVAAARKLLSL